MYSWYTGPSFEGVFVVFWPLKARRDVQETAEDLSKRWLISNRGIEINNQETCFWYWDVHGSKWIIYIYTNI